MKRLKQFECLVVEDMEIDEFHRPPHHQNYFEIAFIANGSGKILMNRQEKQYTTNDIFLIGPDDLHYFDINEKTRFIFIKFNEDFFSGRNPNIESSKTTPLLDLFSSSYLKEISPVWSASERHFFSILTEQILEIRNQGFLQRSSSVYFLIAAILAYIDDYHKRSISVSEPLLNQTGLLLHYLHQNIYFPEKIRIRTVAQHFHISENYFGEWFRKNFDCSYKEYTDRYRMILLENRISLKNSSLKEIADEFGFSDVSHLSRYFLQQTGLRPKAFLKQKESAHAIEFRTEKNAQNREK